MIRGLFFSLLILAGMHLEVFAQQQVVATAGECFTNANGSVSWSIGEFMVSTYVTSGSVLTQGFQQVYIEPQSIEQTNNSMYFANAYPNPAHDNVFITVDNPKGLKFKLFDATGRKLFEGPLKEKTTEVDVQQLPPSFYFIKIFKGRTDLKIFKLVKQ